MASSILQFIVEKIEKGEDAPVLIELRLRRKLAKKMLFDHFVSKLPFRVKE